MKKINFRDLLFYLLLLALLLWVVGVMGGMGSGDQPQYSDIKELFQKEEVYSFVVDSERVLHLELRTEYNGADRLSYPLGDLELFYQDLGSLIRRQHEAGVIESYEIRQPAASPWWLDVIQLVMLGLLAVLLFSVVVVSARQAGPGGGDKGVGRFNKAQTRKLDDNQKKVTFADVAGADEEKEELQELVDFLKDPAHFIELGARIPKGVLLVGPPGTGKTLLARAVAGEAGVQFLSISGSDFVELYVGVGASRVRDLFEQAKSNSPTIVFIDEIDAVGRRRGAGLGGGHDEREQTLNQLLVEMDGFAANEGVIVLAATNRPDILDPALLRPGRLDRQVYVGQPDIKGREEILKIHARNKPLGEDVDLKSVAQATGGFVGADLENLMNEAALLAARSGSRFITKAQMDEAMMKVIAGPEKKSRVVTPHVRKLTAYHEAGHAVVIHALETPDPVHHITIIPRGKAGGMTVSLPQEDKGNYSKRELEEEIAVLLGGRVAEQQMLGDISTGASNDLERATRIARAMVTKYGMSEKLGTVVFDSGSDEVFIGRSMAQARTYSEEVAGLIDREIHDIIAAAYRKCEEILERDRAQLVYTAEYLLEHETMPAEKFELVYTDPDALKAQSE